MLINLSLINIIKPACITSANCCWAIMHEINTTEAFKWDNWCRNKCFYSLVSVVLLFALWQSSWWMPSFKTRSSDSRELPSLKKPPPPFLPQFLKFAWFIPSSSVRSAVCKKGSTYPRVRSHTGGSSVRYHTQSTTHSKTAHWQTSEMHTFAHTHTHTLTQQRE